MEEFTSPNYFGYGEFVVETLLFLYDFVTFFSPSM